MTEPAVVQWVVAAVSCCMAYGGARESAKAQALTWLEVFALGIWVAMSFAVLIASGLRGQSALIALAMFVLALVVGATMANRVTRTKLGFREARVKEL